MGSAVALLFSIRCCELGFDLNPEISIISKCWLYVITVEAAPSNKLDIKAEAISKCGKQQPVTIIRWFLLK